MSTSSISFQAPTMSMEDLLKQEALNVEEVSIGKVIHGKIVAFHNDKEPGFAIVSMGTKSEGKIYLREFDETPVIGQDVEAIAKAFDKDTGLIILSKRDLERIKGWEIVEELFEKALPVIGSVKRKMANGYVVNVESIPMFMPHSMVGSLAQLAPARGGKGAQKRNDIIGESLSVKIVELNHKRKTGIVSRKAFQDEQNGQLWKELGSKIKIGDVVEGRVVKHIAVGVFIEVYGVLGFLHNNNISWERKKDSAKENLQPDQIVNVRILEIEPESNRISLGLKQLTQDPWESVASKIKVGDKVKGTVSFLANYGAFVDIGGGLEGLLHISEMSWTRKVNHAREIFRIGQEIEAKVIGLNPADKRISLGYRQLFSNPWDDIKKTYKVGQTMKGKIKDLTNFGAFVSITDEIDGLIRKEDINWSEPAVDPRKHFKVGEEVEFKITEINLEEKRIGLSIRHLLDNPYKELRRKYPRGTVVEGEVTGVAEFGIFVRFDGSYEGLVHLNNMTKEQSEKPRNHFKKGDKVKVVVKSVDAENRKISLSIRDVEFAMERMEIAQYLEKDTAPAAMASPFSALKNFVR